MIDKDKDKDKNTDGPPTKKEPKLWKSTAAVGFIADALDVATQAERDGRRKDVARALLTIADVAGAAALVDNSLSMAELQAAASPEATEFAISKQAMGADPVPAAISVGRMSLGISSPGKPNPTTEDV